MATEKIVDIRVEDYTGDVYNLEVEPNHEEKDDQFYLCADTGIVIHNCHPRDNIALRWMAKELDLGYDLFDAVMNAREKQAKNMADKLKSYGLPIVIMGKSYKPGVEYEDGSSSVLVGSYIDGDAYYDIILGEPAVYLMAHPRDEFHLGAEDSVVVDPWRKVHSIHKIYYYGNTRKNG